MMRYTAIFLFASWLATVGYCQVSESSESPHFEREILPLLYGRCFSCHSEKQAEPKAGLRLDSAEGIAAAKVLNVAKPEESELLIRVSLPHADEGLMPPLNGGGQPLNDAERNLLRRWIAAGASMQGWKRFEHREAAVDYKAKPVTRTDVPQLVRQFDAIVERHHSAAKSSLNSKNSDEAFLRRVYLDVAGRIPSLAESQEFLDNTAPDKRSRLIDTLLDGEGYISHTFNWKADQLRLITRGLPGQPGYLYDEWLKESIRSGMPHDEMVRRLITADGYLWDDGAVGFYLRDRGMPFDHMSNMARVFLGTRLECAQCHDHPFEPITQREFYELTAYTFGVSNLYASSGYSTENVKQWKAVTAKLDAMDAPKSLRDFVSVTAAPLKRLTKDTEHRLRFGAEFVADPRLQGQTVQWRTIFGDEAPASVETRREALAAWMTSPRNPRFAKNIANRLFKRVMGVGLIEPVDSFSPVNRPQHAELLGFLTETMCRLQFDERAFLSLLLNSRLYQSEAGRGELETGAVFPLRGPLLRRLSAEQLWDSLLTLLVEDLDERKPAEPDRGPLGKEYLARLTNMTADELLARSYETMEYHTARRTHTLELEKQRDALRQARVAGNVEEARRLQQEFANANEPFEELHRRLNMGGPATVADSDPRWVKLPSTLVRASELPTPISLGHFLRQFGQSDRREIDAFNRNPNVTHSLGLMNGELTTAILEDTSLLRRILSESNDAFARTIEIYRAVLVRSPTEAELSQLRPAEEPRLTQEADLIWALINSPEFLFQQ